MKIKHIRWIAIIGLLAIFSLQYVWLVNTCKLAKESIQFRSNEVFKDASMQELFHRMEVLKAELNKKYAGQDTIIGVKVELDDDYDIAESGMLDDNANQWLMSNMHISIQEAVAKTYKVSVSLASLDSIYRANLNMEGIDAKVVCCITDSSGHVLKSSRPLRLGEHGMLSTPLYPLNYKRTENLQAFIVNPYWVIFQRMTLLLIATVLMMILIIGCIVCQIRIIARQNKIAKIREDFSYALIHDMKTPISSILMGIQILETGKLDARPDKRDKLFHILKDESEHLLALTEKVLILSKLENHQLKLFREMLSLRDMLDDLIEKFSVKADKPVHFSLVLEVETILADGEFLKEAISNLIDNAIKYSGASVDITISSVCKPDGAVVIKVKDNGFGIPLKDQSRIFEKYERASAATRSRKGGASGFGLGLNYVLRVAEAHGGTVRVESIEGEYSEFSLSLPQKEFLN